MTLKGKKIGFALTGSHCTLAHVINILKEFKEKHEVEIIPIFSDAVFSTDTKFGPCKTWIEEVEKITGNKIINSITGAEPIGPQELVDCMVVAPCTGNTLAKLTVGITDGAVLMAVKAHLRNQKPVVIGVSTNDGLGANAKNIGMLLNSKNIYFIPFGQDAPLQKPNSIVADFSLVAKTVELALKGEQIQPILLK